MKRLICAFAALILLFASVSLSESGYGFVYDIPGAFTSEEAEALEANALAAYNETGCRMYVVYLDTVEGETSIKSRTLDFCGEHGFGGNSIVFAQSDEYLYVYAYPGFSERMPDDFLQLILELDNGVRSSYEVAYSFIDLCRSMLIAESGTPSPAEPHLRLVDEDDMLAPEAEASLLARLNELSENGPLDVVVVIPKTLSGKSAQAFADDYYDYNGYGNGPGDDGVLFMFCMEDRDMAVSTYGYGTRVFTDYGISGMLDEVRPYLSGGDYAGAISAFINRTRMYIDRAENGEAYDGYTESFDPNSSSGIGAIIIMSLVIAFFITFSRARSSLKTIRRKAEAAHYLKEGPVYAVSEDRFLNTTVTKTRIVESSSSSGGGRSGGSSTHVSSSGRSHGGGSGKF